MLFIVFYILRTTW